MWTSIQKYKTRFPQLDSNSHDYITKLETMIRKELGVSTNNKLVSITDFTHYNGIQCNYVSSKVSNNIEKTKKIGCIIESTVHGRLVKIHFILPHHNNYNGNLVNNYCKKWANNMFAWLRILYTLSTMNCANTLDIYLFIFDDFKLLPETAGEIISRDNANTAYTYPCKSSSEIIICRSEEWFKVFIHESLHSFGIDFSHSHALNNYAKPKINDRFTVQSDYLLFETYSELCAELINAIFVSIATNQPFTSLIQKEQSFTLFQMVKILKHFRLTVSDLVSNSPKLNTHFKEDTNVFSYYFLKCMLMYDLNSFIGFLQRQHNQLKFIETNDNMDDFLGLLFDGVGNPEFLKSATDMELAMNKHAFPNNTIKQTMRMTLLET